MFKGGLSYPQFSFGGAPWLRTASGALVGAIGPWLRSVVGGLVSRHRHVAGEEFLKIRCACVVWHVSCVTFL